MMETQKYFAGIDVGSTATKATVIDSASRPLGQGIVSTGVSGKRAADTALTDALRESDLPRSALSSITATGYGRELVSFADRKVTEITCHARGAWAGVGKPLSLIDIGGQDTKVISVGDSGRVQRFVMNDRCAAGTGRFLAALLTVTEQMNLPLTRLPELPYNPPTERLSADRCAYCYRLRLLPVARLAKRLGMAFTTTLLYSKYQRHDVIRRVAEDIAADLDVPFFYQDWRPRFNQGQSHARQLQIYRQRYCGCEASKR